MVDGKGVNAAHREAIETFVNLIASVASSNQAFADLLRQHACYHNPAPLPAKLKRLAPKRCFANAQQSVLKAVAAGKTPMTYVEGYGCSGALSTVIPIHHAWLIDDEGNVVDQTWESPETSTYFGLAFSTDYVVAKAKEHRTYDSLLDDRRDRWLLLRDPAVAASAIIPHRQPADEAQETVKAGKTFSM